VVFPPYSRHASPSGLWRSPLPQNRSRGKAVRPNHLPPFPPVSAPCHRRTCWRHLPASASCQFILPPYSHVTSIHADITLLTSSCHVIHRTGSHLTDVMLTSSSLLAQRRKSCLGSPNSKSEAFFHARLALITHGYGKWAKVEILLSGAPPSKPERCRMIRFSAQSIQKLVKMILKETEGQTTAIKFWFENLRTTSHQGGSKVSVEHFL